MYDTTGELAGILRATPEVLRALLRDVTPERARMARGGDEGWSVVEVLCHLRDAEERALARMRTMRDEANPVIHGYDQEAWARERDYAGDNIDSAFAAFVGLRAQHVADLEALRPDEWERPGQHSEAGAVTIRSHTIHIAHHDAVHAAQIARQLAS